MTNPFIDSSFTLRPPTNSRDKPELTLRQTEVARIQKETSLTINCSKGGRAFKRQRLFMDRPISTKVGRGFCFDCHGDDCHDDEDQYISEDEYDTPIMRQRVSSEFPSSNRISTGSNISESNYWKTRCFGMQNFCDESKVWIREAEEDQRQLRRRIRELEEQLLLQTSRSSNKSQLFEDEGDSTNEGTLTDRAKSDILKGKKNRGNEDEKYDKEMNCSEEKNIAPMALVIEIKENHQAVSSCFYLTDCEGLNESYEMDMEENEDILMDINVCDRICDEIDDDRNDMNVNQRRG